MNPAGEEQKKKSGSIKSNLIPKRLLESLPGFSASEHDRLASMRDQKGLTDEMFVVLALRYYLYGGTPVETPAPVEVSASGEIPLQVATSGKVTARANQDLASTEFKSFETPIRQKDQSNVVRTWRPWDQFQEKLLWLLHLKNEKQAPRHSYESVATAYHNEESGAHFPNPHTMKA